MNSRKTVLVLFPDEISACIEQFPWLTKEANWLCLTIDALDRCLKLRIPNAQMPTWLQAVGTFSEDEYQSVFSKLQELEESCIEQRRSMGFNENAYWNHQHNLILLSQLTSAQKTAVLAADNLSKSVSFLMLQRLGAGDYHHPGGLVTTIMLNTLQRAGFQIETIYLSTSKLASAYASVYSHIPNYWSVEVSNAWIQSNSNVLVSPCGLFYKSDHQKFLQLLQNLGVNSKNWMLSPPFWSVIPDGSGFKERVSIQSAYDSLSSEMQQALIAMVENMTASTDELMQEILSDHIQSLGFYQFQIQRIKQRHLFQCLTLLGMAHLCAIKPMDALVVSNLDGGINGPLFSVAQENSSPCYMLPHSHVVNQPSDSPCTVITEYWQPKPSMTYRGEVNTVIHVQSEKRPLDLISLSQEKRPPKALILFNGIHRWTYTTTSLGFLKKTLSDIALLCSTAGVELSYRLKPGDQTPLDAYSHLFGIDRVECQRRLEEPLDDMLKNTTLVIALDNPSTALWGAIELGCAVVLISNRPFTSSTLVDGDILQSHLPEQGLNLIGELLSDPNKLKQMRLQQFSKLNNLRNERVRI
jgi:hypothetical protein